MEENIKENKMGVMPVKKLVIDMSLPIMISMLVQALYNVVDSIFVSMLGEAALTAVTVAFPLQNLVISIASGTGVGMNAILSRSLGEKNQDKADQAAASGIFLAFVSMLVFFVLSFVVTDPFIHSQTTDSLIRQYGDTYLGIVTGFSVGAFFQVTFERLLQSTGRTRLSMISQLTGAIFNIIFDPLLIFGIGPFPKLGVAGAAIATVLGQCVAACIGLYLNVHYNTELHFSLKRVMRPAGAIIAEIYAIGIPSILMMAIGSVMTYCMDLILIAFSSTVYFKLQSFFFMPIFGLNNGLIPMLAYNFGARKRKRIDETFAFAFKLAVVIMLIGTAVFEIFPEKLLQMFNASDDMLRIGVPALRIIAIHFVIAAVDIVMGGGFQAFAMSIYSFFISLGRQLVVLIPVAWLLAKTGNVNNVWWCFLIAEFASFLMSTTFFRKLYRERIKPLAA